MSLVRTACFVIDRNSVAEFAPPALSLNEEASRAAFAVDLNVKRAGSDSNNLTEMTIGLDIGIRQDNSFPSMKIMIRFRHMATQGKFEMRSEESDTLRRGACHLKHKAAGV